MSTYATPSSVTWPIGAAMLPFPNSQEAEPETWLSQVAQVADGTANYRQAIQIALEAGFDGPVCVEHYGGEGLTVSAENRDYIRRMLTVALGETRQRGLDKAAAL